MPKSSNTENTGPSSGSTISFLTELMKCLSPVISSRTTDEITNLKKHLQTIKGAIVRLLNGDKIVPDCGLGYAHIPLRILGRTHNKNGKPHFHPEIRFLIKEIIPVSLGIGTVLTAPMEKMLTLTRSTAFDIVIRAYIPNKVHITDFTVRQCTFDIPEDEAFISLSSLRKVRNINEYCKRVQCSFVAHNFTLTVCSGHDGYQFNIQDEDTEFFESESTEIPFNVFEPTSN